jgi:hypothetical protein
MEILLKKDKETKGTVRYADIENHNLYLKKEEAAELGNPDRIMLTVEPITVKAE